MIKDKKIIVTGGAGFLGSHITKMLQDNNEVIAPRSKEYDLKDDNAVKQLFADNKGVNIVIHAAADIGGIGYSSTHSGNQFYNNTLINLNIVHESYLAGIEKFVGVGSVCEYPASSPVPFKESDLWNGYPVVTNDAYGLTKRMLLAQCIAYKRQYGFNFIHLLPVNLYGPKDDFNLSSSHVIPALIRKTVNAIDNHEDNVDIWGTGDESREFLYVEDAARAVVLATELYEKDEPVNLGTGSEITIKELAKLIGEELGYTGRFTYLKNGLGGQQRRMLDVNKAKKEFNFEACVGLHEGIKNTIDYFYQNKNNLLSL